MKIETPKYLLICKDIVQRIESGDLMPGDKVPSENDLIKNYKVSNTTARKSLLEVELQGWATRIKGKGTFVLNKSEDRHLTRLLGSFDAMKKSFDVNLLKEGFVPKNVILEKTILENGISLKIDDRHLILKGPVLKLHRLRYADDVLIKDEIKYISLSICPKIHFVDLEQPLISIYEQEYQLNLTDVQRSISTIILYPDDKNNNFENDQPLATFILDGAIFCNDHKIVEFEKSMYRGDRYKFSIDTQLELD